MVVEKAIHVKGFTKVVKKLDAIRNLLENPQGLYHDIAIEVRKGIRKRTLAGKGPTGTPYKENYSKGYKRFREEQGLPVDHVYLKWSGGMLNAIVHFVTKEMLRMCFADKIGKPYRLKETRTSSGAVKPARTVKQTLTEAQKAAKLFEVRPFFLLDEGNIRDVERIVKRHIKKAVEQFEFYEALQVLAQETPSGARLAPLDVFGIDLES